MAKRRKQKDPFAKREAQNYENPVPSREFILQFLTDQETPVALDTLIQAFDITDAEMEPFQRRLHAMVRDGQLFKNRRGSYGLSDRMNLIRGHVIGHPDGYGFLVPDEGGPDLFLSTRQMRSLLHGDRAVVRIAGIDRRGRHEGALVEVLERANSHVVGRLFVEHDSFFVVPNNKRISQDIMIPKDHLNGAVSGQIVIADIKEQPTYHSQPEGEVVEVLGDHMAPGMEIDIAIRSYGIPLEWPSIVDNEITGLDETVPDSAAEGREDIRDLPLITIDGEDARDFDDAVYCEPDGDGWRLLVAIADVSHYVHPETGLDAAAILRGNSVYFPERVIPMLPEVLSNGLCSLNPDVNRLCLVCEMSISSSGDLKKYRFFNGIMRSHARLTYTKVAAILEGDKALRKQYEHLLTQIENLHSLYRVLHKKRNQRGAIDFDTTETRIVFGEHRKIEKIVPVVRNDAHRLIEECMITANIAAASFLSEHKMPLLYRVHDAPSIEKITDLREFLKELGLTMSGGDEPEPKHYAKLLRVIAERADAHLIQTVLLRSLSQAMYSPDNIGHFGLALEKYAHFTSPIRRYPDLLVHRAIRHVLSGGSVDTFYYNHNDMQSYGEHFSTTERRADEATRDAVDWLKCEYMMDKVGEEFDGIITTVTAFGLFVELDDIYVEGLVHVTALDNDYYQHDPVHHRLSGERTRTTYQLADRIRVKVVRVDLDERKIDFTLPDSKSGLKPGLKPGSKSSGKQKAPKKRKKKRSRK